MKQGQTLPFTLSSLPPPDSINFHQIGKRSARHTPAWKLGRRSSFPDMFSFIANLQTWLYTFLLDGSRASYIAAPTWILDGKGFLTLYRADDLTVRGFYYRNKNKNIRPVFLFIWLSFNHHFWWATKINGTLQFHFSFYFHSARCVFVITKCLYRNSTRKKIKQFQYMIFECLSAACVTIKFTKYTQISRK